MRYERAAAAVAALALSACATNPVTGQKEYNLMSEAQEIQLGREADPQVRAEMGVYPDPAWQEYVQSVGLKLAKASERPDLPWSFAVVDVPAVNAFALPGGYIYITRGLLAHLDSEAEMAGVLGHEIGHVTARHAARAYTRQASVGIGAAVTSIFFPEAAPYASAAQTGLGVLFLKYDRNQEVQSDSLGVRYASKAGWQPSGMSGVLETLGRIGAATDRRGVPNWLSTHPQPADRVAKVAADVAAVDEACGELIDVARKAGAAVVVLSEYGITEVANPVHVNRALRRAGWLKVREELGREQLDAGASEAFAVADHQLAHVYVARPELVPAVAALLRSLPGVERVLDEQGKRDAGLDHPRSGELVAIADARSWFTYYHFLDEDRAPDYARTVDIHRKPGYDPAELFVDPRLKAAKLRIALRLAQKLLGMRYLMDVIPLDATLVRGSHGRPTDRAEDGPLFITSAPELLADGPVAATSVKALLLEHVFGADGAAPGRPA
jgi:hypothetical protein